MLVSLPLKIGIHPVLGGFIPFLIAMLYNGIDMSSSLLHDTNYQHWLSELKTQIRQSQIKAALAVNAELVLLYWHIGTSILEKQATLGWGAKVIDQLSKDLKRSFPDMKGFSARNLKYMRRLAEAYPEKAFVQQAAAQIPWFHNCVLLDKVKDEKQRLWYITQTQAYGWSRNMLVHQIDTKLYERQGGAATNFAQTLPPPQSDLAQQLLKDPYNFDFLTLDGDAHERELEKGLLSHLRQFMLELGVGFAFVGSQYHLAVGQNDYYIDLLFYHLKLRCYVVIDLKMKGFKPEYAGKMNFYLSAVDDLLRHEDDNPTIGLILCRGKDSIEAEYSLRDINKPLGISEYDFTEALPENLKTSLPTIEELEHEMKQLIAFEQEK